MSSIFSASGSVLTLSAVMGVRNRVGAPTPRFDLAEEATVRRRI